MEIHITSLEKITSTGLVTSILYNLQKAVGEHTAEHLGLTLRISGDPSSSDFVAYENLTEDIVKAWVLASYPQLELDALEDELDHFIANKVDSSGKSNGIPWGH